MLTAITFLELVSETPIHINRAGVPEKDLATFDPITNSFSKNRTLGMCKIQKAMSGECFLKVLGYAFRESFTMFPSDFLRPWIFSPRQL